MPTLTQILGGLVVVGVLAFAAHDVWLHGHPASQGLPYSRRRLRRRLAGVAIILVMIALLTWAGRADDPRHRLALYTVALLPVFFLFGLAVAAVRGTARQVIRDQITMNPPAVAPEKD